MRTSSARLQTQGQAAGETWGPCTEGWPGPAGAGGGEAGPTLELPSGVMTMSGAAQSVSQLKPPDTCTLLPDVTGRRCAQK